MTKQGCSAFVSCNDQYKYRAYPHSSPPAIMKLNVIHTHLGDVTDPGFDIHNNTHNNHLFCVTASKGTIACSRGPKHAL